MEYYADPTQRFPSKITTCPGMNRVMPILQDVFDPIRSRVPIFRDCVLISLDAEFDTETHTMHQIGLATLDTRRICQADNQELAKTIISSRMLLLRKQQSNKGAYLFGHPEDHRGETLDSLLLPMFTIHDSRTMKLRNIILVGHGIKSDIQEIEKSSGLCLLALPAIKAVVDTSNLINQVYNTSSRYYSLRDTCTLLGMYKRNIHTAGNDAMYTLKALLLLFCHYMQEKQKWNLSSDSTDRDVLYECQLEAIKRIGRCNNGIGRFAKQRQKRKGKFKNEDPNKTVRGYDVLVDDSTEEGVMDQLFAT